jgi:hypothetical protein
MARFRALFSGLVLPQASWHNRPRGSASGEYSISAPKTRNSHSADALREH